MSWLQLFYEPYNYSFLLFQNIEISYLANSIHFSYILNIFLKKTCSSIKRGDSIVFPKNLSLFFMHGKFQLRSNNVKNFVCTINFQEIPIYYYTNNNRNHFALFPCHAPILEDICYYFRIEFHE